MTDNEIINALECCTQHLKCPECPMRGIQSCISEIDKKAIDLIKRQQAEIERLNVNMNAFALGMKREKERTDNAIKEFGEKVKEIFIGSDELDKTIDDIVKEMVGEADD